MAALSSTCECPGKTRRNGFYISNRLNVYNEQTATPIDLYRNEVLLLSVTATCSDAVIDVIKENSGK